MLLISEKEVFITLIITELREILVKNTHTEYLEPKSITPACDVTLGGCISSSKAV